MAKSVTHKEFLQIVQLTTGASSMEAADTLSKAVLQAVVLAAGRGTLVLRNHGTYKTVMRKSRLARNPQTGEAVTVPARERLVFKPSDLLAKD